MTFANLNPTAPTALLPHSTWRGPDGRLTCGKRQIDPQPKQGLPKVVVLASTLGCFAGDTCWQVPKKNACFYLVAMLAAGSRATLSANLTLRQ